MVHRSYLKRLMCPANSTSFSDIADYVYDRCPLPGADVGAVEHTFLHFGIFRSECVLCLFGGCARCIIAGGTQELYTCLFRQIVRLLPYISQCFAQPALGVRCISLSCSSS